MATLAAPRARAKSALPVCHRYFPVHPGTGTLEISRGNRTESYTVAEQRHDAEFGDGRAFRLTKDSDRTKVYDLFLAEEYGHSTCDCADFIFAAEEDRPYECKHLTSVKAIVASGEIDRSDETVPVGVAVEPVSVAAPAGPKCPCDRATFEAMLAALTMWEKTIRACYDQDFWMHSKEARLMTDAAIRLAKAGVA